MSDEGGGGSSGGGSSKGGGSGKGDSGGSTGFTNPNNPGGSSISQSAATPASSSAIPIIGASGTFGASDGSSASTSFGSGSSPSSTASLGSPQGVTASPAGGASSALGLAPPVGFGTSPSDLSSNFDPLSGQPAAGQPGANGQPPAAGGTALTSDQLGKPASTPATGASATASGASGDKSILDSLGIKSPLGAAIGAAGLGYSVLTGQKQSQYAADMSAQASQLNAQGQQLLSYLQNGNLPPGLQQSLTQATSAAKAKIISNFASQGLNTDPAQNTALAQELAAVDQQALISTAQIGQQLMTSGLSETGLSSQLYTTLAGIDQTQTANIGKAIANFASSISGSGGGITLKLPGQ